MVELVDLVHQLRRLFQYSLCRVVLMGNQSINCSVYQLLSVLALSSRFDGRSPPDTPRSAVHLSVLALSSRFDGPHQILPGTDRRTFSTRSVESF